jgi:putative SOS response-associated peptidase YedK
MELGVLPVTRMYQKSGVFGNGNLRGVWGLNLRVVFTVITTTRNKLTARIHNQMPVLLQGTRMLGM